MPMFSEYCNSLPTPPFHLNNLYNSFTSFIVRTTGLHQKLPLIIPRHLVSPGLTNHNHSQHRIASRDRMLPSDWSDVFCRAEILRPLDMRNVSPGCRVDIYKLDLQTKVPKNLQSRRRPLLGPSPD